MAHRHKVHKRAKGGTASAGEEVYSGKGSHVAKEASSKKDAFKHGGRKHLGAVHGHKSKPRADKRARGGGVGANKSPFSTAAKMEDHKRSVHTVDSAQPRKNGGGVFARGGRPHPLKHKHHMNFGNHKGAGHEEALEHHLPVHHKHGGKVHKRKHGGKVDDGECP